MHCVHLSKVTQSLRFDGKFLLCKKSRMKLLLCNYAHDPEAVLSYHAKLWKECDTQQTKFTIKFALWWTKCWWNVPLSKWAPRETLVILPAAVMFTNMGEVIFTQDKYCELFELCWLCDLPKHILSCFNINFWWEVILVWGDCSQVFCYVMINKSRDSVNRRHFMKAIEIVKVQFRVPKLYKEKEAINQKQSYLTNIFRPSALNWYMIIKMLCCCNSIHVMLK